MARSRVSVRESPRKKHLLPPTMNRLPLNTTTGSRSLAGYVREVFFSSRKRHTRCLSDWSSDVCYSDLVCRLLLEKKKNTHRMCSISIEEKNLGKLSIAFAEQHTM